jgi:mannose/fructose-specific phosphotransferase system component IIA
VPVLVFGKRIFLFGVHFLLPAAFIN